MTLVVPGRRLRLALVATVGAALTLAGCGSSSSGHASSIARKITAAKPARIYPAPAGLVSAGAPQPNGTMWLLVHGATAANVQALDLSTGKVTGVVPVSSSASAVTELSTGVLVVGTATAEAGSLELRNGTTGSSSRTIPLSGPVRALAAGANGTTVYALVGTSKAESVEIVDSASGKVTGTIAVSTHSVAVAASPSGSDVYVLGANGTVTDYPVTGGSTAASFPVGSAGVALAVSPSGSTLYVLKGQAADPNVAVVDLATESVGRVLPAPAHAVAVSVAADGSTLYDVVGTSSYGNVQAFSLG